MTTASLSSWLRGLFQRRSQPVSPAAGVAFGGEHQQPVAVYTAVNRLEADLVIALLASEDIPAFAGNEAVGQVYGLQIGPLAAVDVLVPAALAETATAIIEQRHIHPADEDADDEEEAGDFDEALAP